MQVEEYNSEVARASDLMLLQLHVLVPVAAARYSSVAGLALLSCGRKHGGHRVGESGLQESHRRRGSQEQDRHLLKRSRFPLSCIIRAWVSKTSSTTDETNVTCGLPRLAGIWRATCPE